jgi:hypothetical protein
MILYLQIIIISGYSPVPGYAPENLKDAFSEDEEGTRFLYLLMNVKIL